MFFFFSFGEKGIDDTECKYTNEGNVIESRRIKIALIPLLSNEDEDNTKLKI